MSKTKIYLGNLSQSVTQETLKQHFSEFGEIKEVLLPQDRKTKQIKGYAFIIFSQESSAEQALAQDGQSVFGQEIIVQIATEKSRVKKSQ
ncbi:MAG: RNA-binding protein [Gammaproteobacteria bacterium]|nr:RNA-binding protein [Gammaproteobacteria bacterium]MCF6229288.1 RNA-binding protein [Gammaproteobacteria bacterium]